ncbi:RNA ligase [Dissulfurispira thermophila]|uniref:RNA ligase n=1 Tax=Dissulfurispira thermophila TaxID=2715679 RepID=A0A7G1H601_9BACT|nr:RNA ligase [Dissulfurispira thermophila]BCB97177.1 RNA ligase [Dissulfurispira thermophila]
MDFLESYLTQNDITILKGRESLHAYEFNGTTFIRLSQGYKHYQRGTVFYDKGIIPGYPRIMRILHLANGINRYFKDKFYIEEKMDGYNVRIAVINATPIAFTRGGFICPFTTDRISDLINTNFFNEYPEYTVCGEVVGPGSPYNTEDIPYIDEDVAFFAFDLIDEKGNHLSAENRYKIFERFNIQQVKRWGPFSASDIDTVKNIVLELDRDSREGIVIKSVSDGKPVKYVTLSSCLRDLEATTHLITELPAGFFMQRILRAVFLCHEFAIPFSNEYLISSAKALYIIPGETLRAVAGGKNIKEFFNVKVRNKNTVDKLIQHLNRSGVRTHLASVEKSGDYYKVKFYKIYIKGTKELRHRLMGKGFFD